MDTTTDYKINKKQEKIDFLKALIVPSAFVLLLWIVKSLELLFSWELYKYGIFPQTLYGLRGILLSPFIHGSFSHLLSNSIPLLVLGTALFYFYREIGWRVILYGAIITGLWVWILARPSFHIGASGVVYNLAAFLLVSGIIRRHPRLMALSLLVAFLYGSIVWGIFPLREQISWESHLMGMISGIVLALFFRAHGPQRPLYSWELEELEEPDDYTEFEELETGHDNDQTGKTPSAPEHDPPEEDTDDGSRLLKPDSGPGRIVYHYKREDKKP
ncbi:MAG: rhomboid family intramembrane serine protease [Bacteroidia bacterium]|nr:MAG: rhomboid family intramembrane serine protease [Bacteroidia bacterium]